MTTPKLPPMPHWCEPGSPFAEQMQAYAIAAIQAQGVPDVRRETLMDVIRRLNGNPYNLTKNECIDEVKVMLASAQPAPQAGVVQQEPFGCVTVVRRLGHADEYHFYKYPSPPYLDNASECHALYTHPAQQAKPQPLSDEQQIAEALRKHGLMLVKTAAGYDVMKLGECTASGIKE